MIRPFLAVTCMIALTLAVSGSAASAQTKPSAAKNPCAAKQPAQQPCAAALEVDPKLITRPGGTMLFVGKRAELIRRGEQLWKDTTLSTNGLSCQTCHRRNANFKATFAKPYPHMVAMVKAKAGLAQIHMDEMVQICMVVPMAAKPLPWDSKELAALTAYVAEVQKTFQPTAKQPCGAKNPCAASNPCAAKR
ncbi:MAG: c-type cytochrome [Candidatus Methylomirabilia bacterium]